MKAKYFKKTVAMAATMLLMTGAFLPNKTEAISLGSLGTIGKSIIKGVQQANQLSQQVNTIENEGRVQFFNQIKEQYGVNYDYRANQQLNRIMSRMSKVLVKYDPTVEDKPYQYFVNNDTSFNAFCTLGHNISVNIGLFQQLNYNEDEIAFVLGHELSHGTHKDPSNNAKKKIGLSVVTEVAAEAAGGGGIASLAKNIITNVGSAKGITLPAEKRSDRDAFVYCSEAGYNVGAGAAVWQRITEMTEGQKASSFNINRIFNPSDHPQHKNRRDDYSKTITTYSNKVVTVDAETGTISVNKTPIGVPAAAFGQTAKERAYMVAGALAGIYHKDGKATYKASISRGTVYLGDTEVLTITNGDDGRAWVDALNKANGF